MPENTFLERLFKPSVKWLDELQPPKETGSPEPNIVVPMTIEPDDDITGGSELEVTSSAHEIMVVIASWTEPILAYLLRKELPKDETEAH